MTPGSLTSLEDALRIVLAEAAAMPAEEVELTASEGRVLAVAVSSPESVPGADNSAMDGFVLAAAATAAATSSAPVRLELVGESRAGAPFQGVLPAGGAARISTGAVVPEGADAVLRVEDTEEEDQAVLVSAPVVEGTDIRRAGEDIRAGDVVLDAGTLIGPAELGVLASVGAARPAVVRRPRVAVLSTGDELIGPGEPMRPGAVRNSNAHALPAQVRAAGAEVALVRMVPDDRSETEAAIRDALNEDIVVLCGGVSVGPHDHAKPALAALGVEERFWRVALRPGKPVWFGVMEHGGRRTLVFGLPGNPVSAMVTFDLFARPAIARMLGLREEPRSVPAILDEAYRKPAGRAHVVRLAADLREGCWHVRPTGDQGSHILTSMLGVDAVTVVPAESEGIEAGSWIEVRLTPRALLA